MVCPQRFLYVALAITMIGSVTLAWFLVQLIIKQYHPPSRSSSPSLTGATIAGPEHKTRQDIDTSTPGITRRAMLKKTQLAGAVGGNATTNTVFEKLFQPELECEPTAATATTTTTTTTVGGKIHRGAMRLAQENPAVIEE